MCGSMSPVVDRSTGQNHQRPQAALRVRRQHDAERSGLEFHQAADGIDADTPDEVFHHLLANCSFFAVKTRPSVCSDSE